MCVVVAEVLDDGPQRLLAAAAHASQREGTVEVVGELGLDVELAAHVGRGGRDAAARGKRIKAVKREVAVDEEARVRGPVVELARREAVRRLAHDLDGEKLACRGVAAVVKDVDLGPRMLLAEHVRRLARRVDGGREALGEPHVDDGQALLGSPLEDLEVAAGRHRAGGVVGLGVLAHVLVELVRVLGLPHVIHVLHAVGVHVGKGDDLDAELLVTLRL